MDHSSHQQNQYTCPMHPQIIRDRPGNCPICGMNLVPVKKPEAEGTGTNPVHLHKHEHAVAPPKDQEDGAYYCPMLCEGDKRYSEPGNCPSGGMDLAPRMVKKDNEEEEAAYKAMLKRFWIAVALTLPVLVIAMGEMAGLSLSEIATKTTWGWVQFALSTPILIYCSGDFFKRGYLSVIRKSPNMWTLISMGAGAAYLFSMVALLFPEIFPYQFKMKGAVQLYFEAAAVILTLILLGQVLELKARGRTNSAIRALLNLVPPEATVVRNGPEQKIPLEHVKVGDILKIKHGEKLPVDGKVIKGHSAVDESIITGDAIPAEKYERDSLTGSTG